MRKELYADWKTTPLEDCFEIGDVILPEDLYHFKENGIQREDVFHQPLIQITDVADFIEEKNKGIPLFDTIWKKNHYSPWIYIGQCREGGTVNRNPALMPFIYVCSAFRAATAQERLQNIEIAKRCCRSIANCGQIPIAPHLYFPRFMDDDIPEERYFGMGAAKKLLGLCSAFVAITVDGRISEGMEEEIELATSMGIEGRHIDYSKEDVEEMIRRKAEE